MAAAVRVGGCAMTSGMSSAPPARPLMALQYGRLMVGARMKIIEIMAAKAAEDANARVRPSSGWVAWLPARTLNAAATAPAIINARWRLRGRPGGVGR